MIAPMLLKWTVLAGATRRLFREHARWRVDWDGQRQWDGRRQIVLVLMLVAVAASQGLAAPSIDQTSSALPAALDSNAILGFETAAAWTPKGDTASGTFASATATRTQGVFAYALMNPSNLTFALTSAPVASTATALAGVGNLGATFQVDVMLPTELGNTNNQGSLQLFISSPSRKLNNVLVGTVSFKNLRLGIYRTLKFPIQDGVRKALGGAPFSDLTFQFLLNSPGRTTGTYLFDNLRVHSVPLVTADKTTRPPAGYGQSVDLVVIGGTPDAKTFDAGIVQVPDNFHLKLGNAGTTTVRLEIGFDGIPSITCSYLPNAGGESFGQPSCNGGAQAGDLLGASWARLTILGGDSLMKIRAQLAKNPVGDLAGAGIIPALPTFWGDFDGCIPAVVADRVKPPFAPASASCARQTAQANQIVTDYFNRVNIDQVAPNWIVTPTPEFARRHGDGSPHDNLTGPPPPPSDPDFNEGGHLNEGGDWDAYWQLVGKLDSSGNSSDFDFKTYFEATLTGHVVVFGEDVNVVTLQAVAETDIGAANLGNPSAAGSFHAFVFGAEVPIPENSSVAPGVEFGFTKGITQDVSAGKAQIWIFVVEFDAKAGIELDAHGRLDFSGLHLTFGPNASLGVHAFGGIGIDVLASGGVDVNIPGILHVGAPVTADATWSINTDPTSCEAQVHFSALGEATVGSDGGTIDLVASFGDCPFCLEKSWRLFGWEPVFNPKVTFLDTGVKTLDAFELPHPTTTCTKPLDVAVSVPTPSLSGVPVPVSASAVVGSVNVPCSNSATVNWSWSSTVPGDSLPNGCQGTATFLTTGPRTITVTVTDTVQDHAKTLIPLSGSRSKSITVDPLPPGVHITIVTAPNGKQYPGYSCSSLDGAQDLCQFASTFSIGQSDMYVSCGALGCTGNSVGPLKVEGVVAGATGLTTWTVTDQATNITTTPLANDPSNPSTLTWTPPDLSHSYTLTMTTTSGGSVYGTATVALTFVDIH
jgi:hypothetical protein